MLSRRMLTRGRTNVREIITTPRTLSLSLSLSPSVSVVQFREPWFSGETLKNARATVSCCAPASTSQISGFLRIGAGGRREVCASACCRPRPGGKPISGRWGGCVHGDSRPLAASGGVLRTERAGTGEGRAKGRKSWQIGCAGCFQLV